MPSLGNDFKITVVGDGTIGKTCLLISYAKNKFPEEYVPTVLEHYGQDIAVDGIEYNMTLWDTAGQEGYERLRALSYPKTNCFFICFSVERSQESYDNVRTKWAPEVRHYNPRTPVLLVASKIDLRDDPDINCYAPEDGKKMMRLIRAQGYVECSAKTREGLSDVFVQAIKIHQKSREKLRRLKCALL